MVIAEKRKKNKKDRTTLTHDCSTLHSPGTNMDFYASRDIDVDMDHSYEETGLNISTDDTLVEDGFNNSDIPQEIQESENESDCEEFPSLALITMKKALLWTDG
ncbi:uncharacterized protein LOC126716580 isoform X2 [Quercus robur]|uniref:uncharacterized protein LOC126716580 isoform X2 n=1 Tax=Quercus robur TaxID=38942 RepID=UPI0021614662|nr:uncharacterized protein LOC126716580 isoform X2 [Quercus robur]